MNRYFVSLMIALGSLGVVTSNAFANPAGTEREIPVEFKGSIVPLCDFTGITITTPGVLASLDSGITLSTATPSVLSGLTCNTDHSISVGTPVQKTAALLPGQTLSNPEYTAKVTDSFGNIVDLTAQAGIDLPLGIVPNVLTVEMTAKESDGSVLKAGNYEFDVPVTITCN